MNFLRFVSTVAPALALASQAHANTLFADFSGGGTIKDTAGEIVSYQYPSSAGAVDANRVDRADEGGNTGAHHVRAFGKEGDDGRFEFVNSAASLGVGSAFAETIIGLDYTNSTSAEQELTLTSTVLAGAMGIYFSTGCYSSDQDTVDLFDCPQRASDFPLSSDRAASVSLDVSVFADGELIDGLSFGMDLVNNNAGLSSAASTISRDIDEAQANLSNFRQLGPVDVFDSLIYAWDESVVKFKGGTVGAGDSTSLRIVFRSFASTNDVFDDCFSCLTSLMGFGDPIGGGSDDSDRESFMLESFSTSFSADFALQASIADTSAVPLPAGVWLMGAGVAGFAGWSRKKRR